MKFPTHWNMQEPPPDDWYPVIEAWIKAMVEAHAAIEGPEEIRNGAHMLMKQQLWRLYRVGVDMTRIKTPFPCPGCPCDNFADGPHKMSCSITKNRLSFSVTLPFCEHGTTRKNCPACNPE